MPRNRAHSPALAVKAAKLVEFERVVQRRSGGGRGRSAYWSGLERYCIAISEQSGAGLLFGERKFYTFFCPLAVLPQELRRKV